MSDKIWKYVYKVDILKTRELSPRGTPGWAITSKNRVLYDNCPIEFSGETNKALVFTNNKRVCPTWRIPTDEMTCVERVVKEPIEFDKDGFVVMVDKETKTISFIDILGKVAYQNRTQKKNSIRKEDIEKMEYTKEDI